jgi:hypothetical protein
LESLIVSVRGRHLVRNARADLRSELQGNRHDLIEVIESAKSSTARLQSMLDDALLGYQMAIAASAGQMVQECDEALRTLGSG